MKSSQNASLQDYDTLNYITKIDMIRQRTEKHEDSCSVTFESPCIFLPYWTNSIFYNLFFDIQGLLLFSHFIFTWVLIKLFLKLFSKIWFLKLFLVKIICYLACIYLVVIWIQLLLIHVAFVTLFRVTFFGVAFGFCYSIFWITVRSNTLIPY